MSNRLAGTASPYLLQHAENPVDWYPWGSEAFDHARRTDRPVFLSIGYAACHWCHVMAHESFEDPQTADFLNGHFVSIKVDREERPDLDQIYMDAVVSLTGQGGWPMSVFLTPDGRPFYGGTYFPPTARHGLPSFRQLLEAIDRTWRQDRQRLERAGDDITRHISRLAQGAPASIPQAAPDLGRAAESLFKSYDWTNGGWGAAPKFPQAMAIEFLLTKHLRDGDRLALDMALHALRAMGRGGIFDQVGGGFHRYATDARWQVPHFEKMLYDNALLASAYLHAWQLTRQPDLRQTLEETLAFALAELALPQGGYASSLDADSGAGEGEYYVWTIQELETALGEAALAQRMRRVYGLTEGGNFEGRNVLRRALTTEELADEQGLAPESVAASLATGRRLLAEARRERPAPGRDDKVIAEWNGHLLAALAESGRALGQPVLLEAAVRLAEFASRELLAGGRLIRSWRAGRPGPSAFLADHAALGLGFLSLYQADFDPRWYQQARQLAEAILDRFTDPQGGFFETPDDHEGLIARPKSTQDNALPSGSALTVRLLLTLEALGGEDHYREAAEGALRAMGGLPSEHPLAFAAWLQAADLALGPQTQLAIAGRAGEPSFTALCRAADGGFRPHLVIAGGDPADPSQPQLLRGRPLVQGEATAYLCREFVCRLPTTSADVLRRQLDQAAASVEADGAEGPQQSGVQ